MLKRHWVKFYLVFASIFILVACSSSEKKVVEKSCNTAKCHGTDVVYKKNYSEQQWDNVINAMIIRGAVVSDKDHKVILKYLTDNYGHK